MCWRGLFGAELGGRNATTLRSPSSVLLSYYNGSLEKRGSSLVLTTCCSANFKPLNLLQYIICLSVLLPSDWAVALEVFYLFSELFETSRPALGLSDFIKGKAVNACIACSDPPTTVASFWKCKPFLFRSLLPTEGEQLLWEESNCFTCKSSKKRIDLKNSHIQMGLSSSPLLFHRFVDNL